jgi:hypothetical protein
VLIAEMLVLVTIKDNGHVPVRNNITKAAVSGALLAELAMDRKLTLAKGGTRRAAGARPRDELLADVYDATRNHLDGRKAVLVISGLSRHIGGSWNRVGDRLVDAGVLGRHRPLGLLMTRYPVIGVAARQAVLEYVQAAAVGPLPLPPDAAVVLSIAGECRLLKRVVPDRRARLEARRRMTHARVYETPFAPDVAGVVNEVVNRVFTIANSINRQRSA